MFATICKKKGVNEGEIEKGIILQKVYTCI